MVIVNSSKKIFDLSKNATFIFLCLWGELLAMFLLFANFHPKIIGISAMVLALFIQYLLLWVWKKNDIGNFYIKLGASIMIPIKYFLIGFLALLLPMGNFPYVFPVYILSMIAGYIFIKIGVRKSLNKIDG